jgi:T-complex protein 1 subunit theta
MKSANSSQSCGFNITNGTVEESSKLGVWDHMMSKQWALRLASDAAITVLRVDQVLIIFSDHYCETRRRT